jgi:hypothetical protein
MPLVEFKPMIPAFEQAKTVHALDPLDCAATAIGIAQTTYVYILKENEQFCSRLTDII